MKETNILTVIIRHC